MLGLVQFLGTKIFKLLYMFTLMFQLKFSLSLTHKFCLLLISMLIAEPYMHLRIHASPYTCISVYMHPRIHA